MCAAGSLPLCSAGCGRGKPVATVACACSFAACTLTGWTGDTSGARHGWTHTHTHVHTHIRAQVVSVDPGGVNTAIWGGSSVLSSFPIKQTIEQASKKGYVGCLCVW